MAQSVRQGVESLFKVEDSLIDDDDDVNAKKMRERQMAYGILLRSIDAMNMTEDAIESKVESIKQKVSSKVRTTYIYAANNLLLCKLHTCSTALSALQKAIVDLICTHCNLCREKVLDTCGLKLVVHDLPPKMLGGNMTHFG